MHQEQNSKTFVPGPGSYSAQSFVSKKFTNKKIRGQTTKVKSSQSYTFTSTSTRSFDPKLEQNIKFHWPAAGQYENKDQIGQFKLTGGAPNNFLLLKNNKTSAPFSSTVSRFGPAAPKILDNRK
jgi:hypothetical protein